MASADDETFQILTVVTGFVKIKASFNFYEFLKMFMN